MAWLLGFVVFLLWLVVVSQKAARKERVRKAYIFDPKNSHEAARFVTDNKALKKCRLFGGKGIPIGFSPDGRHAMNYSGFGHLLTIAAARTGKGATLIVNALLGWKNSCIVIDPKAENALNFGASSPTLWQGVHSQSVQNVPERIEGHARAFQSHGYYFGGGAVIPC